ncbi:MAG: type II toxin-antitoxin system VapC family toxin [Psychrosphaera sp.]|nr:type II toxin-antitoxin system VapC family toxin [Psychrosphaera sp.]
MKQTYMLDTNMCALILNQRPPQLLAVLQGYVEKRHRIVISSITCAELLFGDTGFNDAAIKAFMARIDSVLPWDLEAVQATAKIKQQLGENASLIGRNDTMIAGHAISSGSVLITNLSEVFQPVPDLVYNDWVK